MIKVTEVTIISGFLGAGKTTLIKKLLKEVYDDEPVSYTHLTLPTNSRV